jgi:hypothetical protein
MPAAKRLPNADPRRPRGSIAEALIDKYPRDHLNYLGTLPYHPNQLQRAL